MFRFLIALLLITPSVANAERFIVTMKSETSLFSGFDFIAIPSGISHVFSAPIHTEMVLPSIDAFVADLNPDQLSMVYLHPKTTGVFKDGVKHLLETDSEASEEGYTYGLKNIKIPEVRARYPFINGSGVVLGIIDSGIDASHPDLQGKVVVFRDFTAQSKPDPYDDNGHGTHVAGTIAGSGLKPKFGVAPEVKLVIAKVFSASGGANDSTILEAMEWMMSQNVAVVSNSWGGKSDTDSLDNPYSKMVFAWIQKRMVPIFAAGNSGPAVGSMSVPGGLPNALAVGAVNEEDKLAPFSSRGPIEWDGVSYNKPDICAPGVKVYSSLPNGEYKALSGTSMATPHVAGVAALIVQANPMLTADQVKEILTSTATPLQIKECGSGRLNAKSAVAKALALKRFLLSQSE